jgi:hypothetical protein
MQSEGVKRKEGKKAWRPIKAMFWLIAWVVVGIVGNFFSLGGEWEQTRPQLA